MWLRGAWGSDRRAPAWAAWGGTSVRLSGGRRQTQQVCPPDDMWVREGWGSPETTHGEGPPEGSRRHVGHTETGPRGSSRPSGSEPGYLWSPNPCPLAADRQGCMQVALSLKGRPAQHPVSALGHCQTLAAPQACRVGARSPGPSRMTEVTEAAAGALSSSRGGQPGFPSARPDGAGVGAGTPGLCAVAQDAKAHPSN